MHCMDDWNSPAPRVGPEGKGLGSSSRSVSSYFNTNLVKFLISLSFRSYISMGIDYRI